LAAISKGCCSIHYETRYCTHMITLSHLLEMENNRSGVHSVLSKELKFKVY
jgi:hypothetical protein